jgi:hypothetical protein
MQQKPRELFPGLLLRAWISDYYDRWYWFVASPANWAPPPSVSSRSDPKRWTAGFWYVMVFLRARRGHVSFTRQHLACRGNRTLG